MGRIKTQLVKRTAWKLFKENKDSFKKDFNENKKIVMTILEFRSKKLRNVVAGYLTRMVSQQDKK